MVEYKEKIKKIVNKENVEKVKEFVKKGEGIAALSYIPLIGWFLPQILRKTDAFCKFHSRQSFLLNITIIVVYVCIWILENFPLTAIFFGSGAILNPITGTLKIIAFVGFFLLSGWAAKKAYDQEEWEIPYSSTLQSWLDRIIKRK